MWTCLNRPCLVLTRLRSATRLVTKGCYSTNSKDTCQDEKEGDEAPPKLSYPFYGKGKATAEGDEADKCVGKSYLSGSRYYVFAGSGGGKYKLPSVTSVIVSTKPKSSEFALKNWRNNLIEKHGEKGFEAIRRETISRGAVFHKVHCHMLSRSRVVCCTLQLRIGQVQNGCLYIRYRSSSQKNEAEEFRKLTNREKVSEENFKFGMEPIKRTETWPR